MPTPQCSAAASTWQAARRGRPGMMPLHEAEALLNGPCKGHGETLQRAQQAASAGKLAIAQHLEARARSGQPQTATERAAEAARKLRLKHRNDARRALRPAPIDTEKRKAISQSANATRPRLYSTDAAKQERYKRGRAQRYPVHVARVSPNEDPHRYDKPKATRMGLVPAKRIGKGKDAKIILSDGTPAPAHIEPGKIPPQWTEVHVALDPRSEVLVTARDGKGQSKDVYAKSYEMKTEAIKFARVNEMILKHDAIASEIQDARKNPKTREEADCAWLMQVQATRPGSDADTKAKVKAYGATTLRAEHVQLDKDGLHLRFIGKEGVAHDHLIKDGKLARMLMERKLAAEKRGDGRLFRTTDKKVRAFTGALDGGVFTPKDFRTSVATRMAIDLVNREPRRSTDAKEHKKRCMAVAVKVSRLLGNQPAQALESYIDPTVFNLWKPVGGK